MLPQRLSILVADDDRQLLRLIENLLKAENYQVITATDGEMALKLAKDRSPALVLLDILMPGMDGFRTCEYIRTFSEVPIIMISARGHVEDMMHGLEVGADDYIVKPFDSNALISRIKTVLSRVAPIEEKIVLQPLITCPSLI